MMLEKLFTTKMSADKKKLENRFLKIRSKNTKLSKLLGWLLFGIIVAAILFAGILFAINRKTDYHMTDTELAAFLNRPVGSVMAELDYLDENKVVFHYLDGFFVANTHEENRLLHAINLKKLNIAGHTQGDCFTVFQIDANGDFAYLTNRGNQQTAKQYDNYIINLQTGDVTLGEMPQTTNLFTSYEDTFSRVSHPYGFYSDRCIAKDGANTHYLTVMESEICSLQLVSVDHQADNNSRFTYLFREYYICDSRRILDFIRDSLPDGEELTSNSAPNWEVNGDVVRSVLHKISELRQMSYHNIPDGNYYVSIQTVAKDAQSYQRLFIVNTDTSELILSERLTDEDYYMGIINILNTPVSDLYHRTDEFLQKEFHRVHDSLYDIQHLTISNWEENGNEATFWYQMTYLYYNRDPDLAEYIREAKERSEEEYRVLYDDYLALKESNYQFKIVQSENGLDLYSNNAPRGEEWIPVQIDDFVLSNWSE